MSEDKLWLESVLKKKAYYESPLNVVDIETSEPIGKNENYLSKIVKIKATVLLGSGKRKKKSLIVKNNHVTEYMGPFTNELGVFVREITMYRDILPKMQDLLEEHGDCDEPFWAKCYDYRLYDRLVLEDLTDVGYRMTKRTEQLNLDCALLAVKQIAKFHAASHILAKNSEIPKDIFGKSVWHNMSETFINQNIYNFMTIAKAMESWGDEWIEARVRFEKAIPTFTSRVLEQMVPEPDDFTVLCHGDCWSNNLLFRKAQLSERPVSVKMVDYQLCFFGPLPYDLNYLLGCSVQPETYKREIDLIIKTYCDSLKSTLLMLNYEGSIPDFDAVKALMKKTQLHFLFTALSIAPVILSDSENIPDLEGVMKEFDEGQGKPCESWNIAEIMGERGKKHVKFALQVALDNEVI